ncbi:MAG TPA: acyltransferase [Caulobacteraceae bacterium]|nr:acyltransferase [Caulobacteraceae bacterium]
MTQAVNVSAASVSAAARLPGLDLLRAVAIGWVMIYHASNFGLVSDQPWYVAYGWMGVDLFFALSGYLIAGQLLRPWARGAAPNYPHFFARRLLRTLPAYLVVVALYFAFPVLREWNRILPLWRYLTFSLNVGAFPGGASFSHAWSLCVEEQFYLVFPLAVALLARRPTATRVVGAVVVLVIGGMALRGWLWLHDVAARPFDITTKPRSGPYMALIYYPTWARLDDLLGGIGVALIQVFRPRWWAALIRRGNLVLALGLAGIAATMGLFPDQIGGFVAATFGFPLLALSMALLVLAGAAPGSLIGRYAMPGAGALAAGAYSLYLSHKAAYHLVILWSAGWPAAAKGLEFPVALAAAIAVGAALYWLVERPFLKLRDRFRDGASARSTKAHAEAVVAGS